MTKSILSSTFFTGLLFVIPIVAQTYSACNPLTGGELGTDWHPPRKLLIMFQVAVLRTLLWAERSQLISLRALPTLSPRKVIRRTTQVEPPSRWPNREIRHS